MTKQQEARLRSKAGELLEALRWADRPACLGNKDCRQDESTGAWVHDFACLERAKLLTYLEDIQP